MADRGNWWKKKFAKVLISKTYETTHTTRCWMRPDYGPDGRRYRMGGTGVPPERFAAGNSVAGAGNHCSYLLAFGGAVWIFFGTMAFFFRSVWKIRGDWIHALCGRCGNIPFAHLTDACDVRCSVCGAKNNF